MHVADRQRNLDRRPVLERIPGGCDQLIVERLLQAVVLLLHAAARHASGNLGIVKNGGIIQAARLPVVDGGLHFQHVDAADHLVHGAEAECRHEFAHLFGDKEEILDHVLGLTL